MVNGAVLSCLGLRDIEFAVAMADPLQWPPTCSVDGFSGQEMISVAFCPHSC